MRPGSLLSNDRDPAIQWLRALAAIEVMIWHSDLVTKGFSDFSVQTSNYAFFGGIGVEIFFIVSGYLMGLIAASGARPLAFARSRATRIYPLYWIFTSLVLLAAWINPHWVLGGSFARSSILASYLIWPQRDLPTLMVGWTLEFELLFYCLVGIVLFTRQEHGLRKLFPLILATIGLIGAELPKDGLENALASHLLSPYMFAFGFGWLIHGCFSSERATPIGILVCFGALYLAALAASEEQRAVVARIGIACTIFTALLATRPSQESAGRASRALAYVGEASYSLYLSHWFLLSILGKMFAGLGLPPSLDAPARILGCLAAVLFGVLVFTFVERPLDRRLRKPATAPRRSNGALAQQSRPFDADTQAIAPRLSKGSPHSPT